jgi:hypothetical protein
LFGQAELQSDEFPLSRKNKGKEKLPIVVARQRRRWPDKEEGGLTKKKTGNGKMRRLRAIFNAPGNRGSTPFPIFYIVCIAN